MKLLLIVDDYLPYSTRVGAKMMHELALELYKKGHEVLVLTPNSAQERSLKFQNIDGITVLYFRSGVTKNCSKFKRTINETLLPYNAYKCTKKFFKKNRCDGIIYYSPTIFFGYLVKLLSKLWNCRSYLILRDIFPQWAVDNHLIKKNSFIEKYFRFFEKINYRSADTIGVMSPSSLEYFKSQNTNINNFEVLYNWTKITELPEKKYIFRKKLNLDEKIVFFYGGNIGYAQQITNLIELSKMFLNNNKVHFLFVGEGDEVDLLLREVSNQNLNNITYLKSVDQRTYFEMLNEFDIGLFSLNSSHKTHNFPGKLLGYMSYSKPILGCVNPGNDLADVINSAKAGFVVNSGDLNSLFDVACVLIESKNIRHEMGSNGRELLSRNFSVNTATEQILNKL